MMGMGFLRLNKILAKHRWHRKENAADEDEEGEYRGSSFTLWLLVLVILVLSILVIGVIHTRQYF
jgi:hypothetical protein